MSVGLSLSDICIYCASVFIMSQLLSNLRSTYDLKTLSYEKFYSTLNSGAIFSTASMYCYL